MMTAASCAPKVPDAVEALKVAVGRGTQAPDPELLDSLTPASRAWVWNVARAGGWPELRNRLLAALKAGKPSMDEPTVLEDPSRASTLFLVRDGLSLRLDLALSGAPWRGLREAEYPTPW